jgi:hypothetical protein
MESNKLTIECTLIGGVLPMFEAEYKGRRISGFFNKNIWNNPEEIKKAVCSSIDEIHEIKPFNLN